MGLKTYKAKRNFKHTPEPRGKVDRSPARSLSFAIQKHDASRLHYDFRLEMDGVLKSWAVPKGPSLDPQRKSLAVQVEDHPLDYGDFEGVIPKGNYGGGTVLLWDRGTWEPLHDPAEGFKAGKLHFVLHGEKLKGEWSLVRMHGRANEGGKNWLLIKLSDSFASSSVDILKESPQSVKTSRVIEKIADERDDVWSAGAKKIAKIAGAKKAAWPGDLSPQLAVLVKTPPAGKEWIHEIKFDGYRLLAQVKSGKVRLLTRNGNDWTHKFPGVAKSLSKLKVDSAIVDGEVVILDAEGRSDFQSLQAMLKEKEKGTPVFVAFDLPYCNGVDLRNSALIERKEQLENILKLSKLEPIARYSEHVRGDGSRLIEKACGMSLEGIISKRMDAPYVSRRDGSWLKSKCDRGQEFVVIGFTPPQGKRTGFGALLLAYYDKSKALVYAGRVGTGFDEALLAGTFKKLKKLEQKDSPTESPPPPRERVHAHWVKPSLVAEVKFTAWTRDGMLRHPRFIAFRSDKPAKQIVREQPVTQKVVKKISKSSESVGKSGDAPETSAGSTSVAGVMISHPDKLLYPDDHVTKRNVIDYYLAAEKWMLPHVKDRPLALVRCPGGVKSKCFFQRNWSEILPSAVDKVNVSESRTAEYHVTIHSIAGIISLAQIGVLEIHTWNCQDKAVEYPDQLIFDLDPGPDLPWKRVIDAARRLKKVLDELRLPTFLKTSGGKGLHLTIPIEPNIDWDTAKSFCATISKSLAEKDDLFVANMRKDLRGGKVYLDYNRNGRGATAVAPYSTRARAGAAVSMPISWDELGKLKSADHFRVETASRYLKQRKTDPWQQFERSRVDLRKLLSRKSAA